MNEDIRLVLDKLELMSGDIRELKGEVMGLKGEVTDLRGEVTDLRSEMTDLKGEVFALKDRMTHLEGEVKDIKEELGAVRQIAERALDISLKTQITLENEISRKIDVIGEGHDFLKHRLDEALQMEKKREGMELMILNLRMDVNKVKDYVGMA